MFSKISKALWFLQKNRDIKIYCYMKETTSSNRNYKNIPPQKMSPLLPLETQHIISFKNLLLPQPKIAFGNSYAAMVEEFHQLD